VLDRDEVRLAQKLDEGGRFAIVHAVELAQLILARSLVSGRPGTVEAQ
jgi:hypothetical protein